MLPSLGEEALHDNPKTVAKDTSHTVSSLQKPVKLPAVHVGYTESVSEKNWESYLLFYSV